MSYEDLGEVKKRSCVVGSRGRVLWRLIRHCTHIQGRRRRGTEESISEGSGQFKGVGRLNISRGIELSRAPARGDGIDGQWCSVQDVVGFSESATKPRLF